MKGPFRLSLARVKIGALFLGFAEFNASRVDIRENSFETARFYGL